MSGFGQPPSGSGGGGFGQPPSGSGGGGFGGPPSGGGGGPEGPLAHIPFSKDDEANLSGMARFAKLAGIAAIISALIQTTAQIVQGLVVENAAAQLSPAATAAVQACFGFVGLVITGALAFFLFKAAAATQKVVATDDADQLNLVEALSAMRIYFMVKGILIILVIVLFCCAFSLIAFGAGAAGAAAAGGI